MNRNKLKNLLRNYKAYDKRESKMHAKIVEFVDREKKCFENENSEGHITASAWVIDKGNDKVCMVHHAKIGKWFQPGGHSDGNSDTSKEALREAREELGMKDLKLASEDIFDIDVHEIEKDEKRGLGKHLHFDIRFLILGDSSVKPKINNESYEVKWFDLLRIKDLNNEESIIRLVEKTKKIDLKKNKI